MARAVRSSGGQLGPVVERGLRATEDFFDALARLELLAEDFRVALIGQCQLIAQVGEAVVDRGG